MSRAAERRPILHVGNVVRWTSQAAGSWKEKVGRVVAVVPAHRAGYDVVKKYSFYGQRDHVSYIIHVPTKTGKGKGTYYWPVVSLLQQVTA